MPSKNNATSPIMKIASGKVRDLYSFQGLIFKTSNRLSVFDVVISENVPRKGAMLNCISQTNKKLLEERGIDTDLIEVPNSFFKSVGFNESELGNMSYALGLDMIPAEIIVRSVMTGSLWNAYKNGKAYCDIELPEGLKEGDILPEPIITPTTKASSGHDKPISKDGLIALIIGWLVDTNDFEITDEIEVEFNEALNSIDEFEYHGPRFDFEDALFGSECSDMYWEQITFAIAHNLAKQYVDEIYEKSFEVFDILSKKCNELGILFVDTKLEFGLDAERELILADEVGTPDSSRFASLEEYEKSHKLVSMDKQIVRDYCKKIGFTGEEGQEIPDIPDWVWQKVTNTYIDLAVRLCGPKTVNDYLNNK